MASMATAATTWTMSNEQPDNNYLTQNARQFAEDIKKATDGQLIINVQSNSVLLKRPEVKRGVQQGEVDLGEMLVSTIGNEDPMLDVDSVPILASSFDETERLWELSKNIMAERLDEKGIVLSYSSPWPPQGIYTKKEISELEDLSGARFRAYSASTNRLASLMGTTPTTVQTPEVPQAFSTDVIDSMLTSPAAGLDTQDWDYVDHYYDAQVFIPQSFVIVNKAAFEQLPEDVQQAVLEASEVAEKRGWEMGRELTAELTQTLADNGMQVHELPDGLRAELEEIGEVMAQEWAEKAGDAGAQLLETYQQQ